MGALEDRFAESERRITASFGVAASEPGEVFDFDAVFARADAGLYQANDSGRNRVCIATAETPARPGPGTTRHQLDAVAIEAA